jgi:hypothetical protein
MFPPIVDDTFFKIKRRGQGTRQRWLNQLIQENGPFCHWCNCRVIRSPKLLPSDYDFGRLDANTATLDHVIALGLGGEDTKDNFVISCYRCNQIKSGAEFFASHLYKIRTCAPNRIFGCFLRNGEAM